MPSDISIECLNFATIADILPTIKLLKKRITEINPGIIHTHLYFSTIFARIASTGTNPIIHTYHSQYYRIKYPSLSAKLKRWCLKWVDKLTYKEKYTILHVSRTQQLSNDSDIGIKNSLVLYNYVEDIFYKTRRLGSFDNKTKLKIISVGNLKTEKNHLLLLKALRHLKHIPIHVNICGVGIDERMLQQYINKHSLPVTILGNQDDISVFLNQHDLFISCSVIEGFGISVAEAMASEIPMIISDIPTFKEITQNKGFFFQSKNARDLADKIELFYTSPTITSQSVMDCKAIAEFYRKSYYLKELKGLYEKILSD